MATVLLSAAGTALGNAVGGSILGMSGAVIGRAVGATLGRVIDQKIMGQGSQVVETGHVDRFRVTGASEGTQIADVYGRVRIPGHVIWASQFLEHVNVTSGGGGGGKGAPRSARAETRQYSYTVSVAWALCAGEISGIGRVWADGGQVDQSGLNLRVYHGATDQMPDPKIEAVEGVGNVPAYRGVAYVVIEDLDLTPFGNRIPQLTFEVVRPAKTGDVAQSIEAVALIPGTGEYALATTPVHYSAGFGQNRAANVNSASGKADLTTSLDGLTVELPQAKAASLIVSWFGDDLRCGSCTLKPKVEHKLEEGAEMPWSVSGLGRAGAELVPEVDGRTVYGGSPTDRSVIEAIQGITASGRAVTFYPFILMEQLAGNGLADPWSDAVDQPELPWRGRITLSEAPGRVGSPDGTAAADAQVAAFFGAAAPGDFTTHAHGVTYSGPAEWSYRRFILHYAHLCAMAGGVEAFCIGSEMRALTQIRGASGFPAVAALQQLAAEVKAILPGAKIGYAADWSEYFGYHPQDGTGDVYFHLDPLWADPNIDFIGIDNYMPLSDWRDGPHLDADWGSIYNLDYLRSNVTGGEGYDWYYASHADRDAQLRSPITDGAHNEPWVFRYKDLEGWWSNTHHDRIGGVRQGASAWVPQSKPIWFTEYGCAAIDKGTNQPNKFLDPKSSESALPHYSSGRRDDFLQAQYIQAMTSYWAAHNPVSSVYGAPMIDMSRAFVWAWDARPYPSFPGSDLWSDGENYLKGHWMNGRASTRSLAGVVTEICTQAGAPAPDVSELYGVVRGYMPNNAATARAKLQPLMLAYGFDAIERQGNLAFRTRDGLPKLTIDPERLAVAPRAEGDFVTTRAPEAEMAGRLRLSFVEADAEFEARAEEAIFPDEVNQSVSHSDMPLVLTRREARAVVERWLTEARVGRDLAEFALPPSELALKAGDVVAIGADTYRIDRIEQSEFQQVEATRVEPEAYVASDMAEDVVAIKTYAAPTPIAPIFLDLPLLSGAEVEHAPHLAVAAVPWPGTVACYSASQDAGYGLNTTVPGAAIIGQTETALPAAKPGVIQRGAGVQVKLVSGTLSSVSQADMLNGANAIAIGDGAGGDWEVFQFQEAQLVGPSTYALRHLLRGQAGTDAVITQNWPEGSFVVVLNAALAQVDLAQSARGLDRHYRIGPAQRSYDDPSYSYRVAAFDGVGLRPYAPVHLRAVSDGAGGVTASWVRRTRLDGDSWQSSEVPLGEAQELYRVQVSVNGAVLREADVTSPSWSYGAAQIAADGVTGSFEIAVAQVSDRFGPGPYRRILVNE